MSFRTHTALLRFLLKHWSSQCKSLTLLTNTAMIISIILQFQHCYVTMVNCLSLKIKLVR